MIIQLPHSKGHGPAPKPMAMSPQHRSEPAISNNLPDAPLRAAAFIPAVFAACFGLATAAHAVPAPLPGLLPNQQDGVFITDDTGRNYSFQTTLEPGDVGCPVALPVCEVFVRLIGLPLLTSPVAPDGFTPGIVQL